MTREEAGGPAETGAPRAATDPKETAGEPTRGMVHADFVAAAGLTTLPLHGPEVAFAGRSNVGKSSLIDALSGRKNLVRTGATPGVTRTLTQFVARTRDGRTFTLVNIPGYGFARRSKGERRQWAGLIEATCASARSSRRWCVRRRAARDRGGQSGAHRFWLTAPHGATERPPPEVLLVATKIDKVSRSAQLAAVGAIAATGLAKPVAWSSVTGQGKGDLARRIALALERASTHQVG